MKYAIAYGRNLDLNRMKEKCPHCVLVGKAILQDWQIAYKRYITLEPCKGGQIPVGVWEINEEAEKELDIIEQYPTVYRKEYVKINFNGKEVEALVYLINDTHPKYPDKKYFERLLVGYKYFDFDEKYLYEAIDRLPRKKVLILAGEPKTKYINSCQKVGIEAECSLDFERINEFDGMIIPGGADVDPKFYGEENYACEEIDTALDEITLQAINYCVQHNKPILGICKGQQILNVAFGGTLKQDIPNHRRVLHNIKIEGKNLLDDYMGENYLSGSRHHQCIDKLGKDLTVIARAEDGTIEAIMHNTKKIIGVQWHPEDMEDNIVFDIFKTML